MKENVYSYVGNIFLSLSHKEKGKQYLNLQLQPTKEPELRFDSLYLQKVLWRKG